MSQSNPDTRPLPPGWISQYDSNYKAWYYVNTQENPPRSVWVHPLGALPPPGPPPNQYAPPPGAPLPTGGYNPGYQYGGPPQGAWGGQGYQGPPQGGGNRGWFGGSQRPPPPTQIAYQQAPPQRKSGLGMGSMLAIGGAGLLGGALLENAWEDHNESEREIGYDQGYDQGFDQGADFGDGGGGGDW